MASFAKYEWSPITVIRWLVANKKDEHISLAWDVPCLGVTVAVSQPDVDGHTWLWSQKGMCRVLDEKEFP